MATEKETVRKPYERPALVKTTDLKKIVALATPAQHGLAEV